MGQIRPKLLLPLFVFAIGFTALMTSVIGYSLGANRAERLTQQALLQQTQTHAESLEQINHTTQAFQAQSLQLEQLKQERNTALEAFASLRARYDTKEVTIEQQQHVNETLTNALARRGGLPLSVIAIEIVPMLDDVYEYRLDVSMVAKDGKTRTLTPKISLLDEDSLVVVPMEPSSYDILGVSLVRGRFKMPEQFTPKQLKVELTAAGQSISQLYDWQLSHTQTNLPVSLENAPQASRRPIKPSD